MRSNGIEIVGKRINVDLKLYYGCSASQAAITATYPAHQLQYFIFTTPQVYIPYYDFGTYCTVQ